MSRRITLFSLIEKSVICPPTKIFAQYKKQNYEGTIDSDGFVLVNGKRYTSLSVAAGAIKASVIGLPSDGLRYRRANGWTFWKIIDAEGNMSPINDYRRELLE